MKNIYKNIVTLFVLLAMTFSQVLACTAITLSKNNKVVSGRTMEWGLDWDWKVIYEPKGSENVLSAPDDLNLAKHTYTSKYAILGTGLVINSQKFLLDGQNTQGLSISANYLPGFTQYQNVTKNDTKYAAITQILTLILSQSATVQQAKNILEQYKVWSDKTTTVDGVVPELHFLITDKHGKSIVVEYIKGEPVFYNIKSNVKVMTNSPTYDWHMINLRNYLNLSNETIKKVRIKDALEKNSNNPIQNINALGQGNGFLGLPGDYSPPSRFIKTEILGYYANNKGDNQENLVSKVTHILNNVDITKGTVVEKDGNNMVFDHTAFTVIKDLSNNKLYVKAYNRPNDVAIIDLNTLIKDNAKAFAIDISKLPYPDNNITNKIISLQ